MAERIDFGQQLELLIQLQEIDTQIYKLNAEKEAKPGEIKQIKESLTQKECSLKDAEAHLKQIQVKRKEKEIDLETKESEVKKLQAQLYQLKTNKEYTTMLHEIEGKKADNSLLEEEILSVMEEIDAAGARMDQEKKNFEEEKKMTDAEVAKIEARIKEIDATLAGLKKQREEITPEMNPRTLKDYERILTGKNGLALVEVQNDACSGCYMNLPPQVINEIKMRDRVIFCENCQRLLYIKDEQA